MQKIALALTLILNGADSESDKKILFSAKILDIQKINAHYPHVETTKVATVARLYTPSLWERISDYFKDPNQLSNNDIAYFKATKEELEKMRNDKCILVRSIF